MSMKTTQLVEARRVVKQKDLPVPFIRQNPMLGLALTLPVIKVDLAGPSALAIKSARELGRIVKKEVPMAKISLYDGHITVNNRKVKLPVGLTNRMSGRAFRKFAGIDRKGLLFSHTDGKKRRISDFGSVDIAPGAKFTHRRKSIKRPTPYHESYSTVSGLSATCVPSRG